MFKFFKKIEEEIEKTDEKVPKEILKYYFGYRVKGLKSVHRNLAAAKRQLKGWKDAK